MAKFRDFTDFKTMQEDLHNNILEAIKTKFPIEDDHHVITVHNPTIEKPKGVGLNEQKKSLLYDRKLAGKLIGTIRLKDKKTGKVLDEKRIPLMPVPVFTDRGTIIQGGNEYTIANQARLKYGVYTRKKQSGEYEATFNVDPTTGTGFKTWMDPRTGVFKFNIKQANIPAYPVLKAMGVTDDQLAKAWGRDILQVNKANNDKRAVLRMAERIVHKKELDKYSDEAAMGRAIREKLSGYKVDPYTMESTLGLKTDKVSPDVIVKSTQKLLNISRGLADPDDRDDLRFTRIYGPEDLLPERIQKDAGNILKTWLYKAKYDKNLSRIPSHAMKPYLLSLMYKSGLVSPIEETNPYQLLEQANRITRMGEGGIGDEQAVMDTARDVRTTQIGYTDPIAGPESGKIGIDFRAAYKTYKGKDGNLYAEFKNAKTGKIEHLNPMQTYGKIIAFPGETPDENGTIVASVNGEMRRVPVNKVDYYVPSMSHMYASNINMVSMLTGFQGARAFYSGKYFSQYIPMKDGEVPLVQTLTDDNKTTFHELYGRQVGTLKSPVSGTVVKVTDDSVIIKGDDGKRYKKELVKNFPFNRLTAISYFPAVSVGQRVKPDTMIAHSNFTDKKTGAFNLGKNLSVAIYPYKGLSHDDAYVISESAAKKLTTERLYEETQDKQNGNEINRKKFISLFPKAYTKKQLENIDGKGVIKVGTIVNKGDPIVLSTRPRTLSTKDINLGRLHKVLSNSNVDTSVKWEHDAPGEVVDVAVTSKGKVKVNIKSTTPAQEGDKLCYTEDHEVLTAHGWMNIKDVTIDTPILTKVDGELVAVAPVAVNVYKVYNEPVWTIETDRVSLRVSERHSMVIWDYSLVEGLKRLLKFVKMTKCVQWLLNFFKPKKV